MLDLHNTSIVKKVIAPISGGGNDTAIVGAIIDRQGYEGLEFLILTGVLTDGDATFTVLVEDADELAFNVTNAAVVDKYLRGTETIAGFTFNDPGEVRKIGYCGIKRYVRMTITPATNTAAWLIAVCALLYSAGDAPPTQPAS